MIFAYADPPYLKQAKKHYGSEEVDHRILLRELADYECWALSCSSSSLAEILTYCDEEVRIAAWVKPFAIFKPNVNPGYCWEPVIFKTSRRWDRTRPTIRDYVSANITLKKGISGAKPVGFCTWLFRLLQAEPEDEFVDLFPGSGIVSYAWQEYCEHWPESYERDWVPKEDLWKKYEIYGDSYVQEEVA